MLHYLLTILENMQRLDASGAEVVENGSDPAAPKGREEFPE